MTNAPFRFEDVDYHQTKTDASNVVVWLRVFLKDKSTLTYDRPDQIALARKILQVG